MKNPYISKSLNFFFLLVSLVIFSCGGKKKADPAPEVAKLTSISLSLDGPKAKPDAVAAHQEAGGITNQTSTNTVTLGSNAVYTGSLTLEETTGSTKANATSAYTTTYVISGVNATISASGDAPTLTTNATGNGTLKVTATKGGNSHSVTFPLTITN